MSVKLSDLNRLLQPDAIVRLARRQADELGLPGKGVYANDDEINAAGNQPATDTDKNLLFAHPPVLSAARVNASECENWTIKQNANNAATKTAANKKGKNMNSMKNALLVDSPPLSLSGDVLRRAAELADGIASQQAELNQLLSGQPGQGNMTPLPTHNALVFPTPGPQASKGRRFTPEARKRISAAQRRRWRKFRKIQTQATAPTTAEATAANATH